MLHKTHTHTSWEMMTNNQFSPLWSLYSIPFPRRETDTQEALFLRLRKHCACGLLVTVVPVTLKVRKKGGTFSIFLFLLLFSLLPTSLFLVRTLVECWCLNKLIHLVPFWVESILMIHTRTFSSSLCKILFAKPNFVPFFKVIYEFDLFLVEKNSFVPHLMP